MVCNNVEASEVEAGSLKHQDSIPHHKEYDEEEWVNLDSFCLFCSGISFFTHLIFIFIACNGKTFLQFWATI